MLIEAVCKYKICRSGTSRCVISTFFISPLDSPNYSDECIFTQDGTVQIFTGVLDGQETSVLLKYKLAPSASGPLYKRYQFSRAGASELSPDTHYIRLHNSSYKLEGCDCAYKTVEASLVGDIFEVVMAIGPFKVDSVLSLLGELLPELQVRDNTYHFAGEFGPEETLLTRYRLLCEDGSVCLSPGVFEHLEKHNTHQRLHNLGTTSTALSTVPALEPPSGDLFADCSHEVVYEHSNSPDFILLLKNLLGDTKLNRHSYITHFYMKNQSPIFITVFAIQERDGAIGLTIFLTRELFSFILLFNGLSNQAWAPSSLLSIEYFPHSDIAVSDSAKELLVRYKLRQYDINGLVNLAYLERRIVLEYDAEAFWILMYALANIEPFVWPGLVIVPVCKSMFYLLGGPYTFLAAASLESATELRMLGICESYSIEDIQSGTSITTPPILDSDKITYLASLQQRKLQCSYAFPLRFDTEHLKHVEEVYLHAPTAHACNYVYDLAKGIVFLPRVYINDEDPAPLWILLSPLEIDYDAFTRHNPRLLPFLARRACIDKDRQNLIKVVEAARPCGSGILHSTLQSICNCKRNDAYGIVMASTPADMAILSVCDCFASSGKDGRGWQSLQAHPRFSVKKRQCSTAACRKYTYLQVGDMQHNLLSVKNLLALLDAEYTSQQVSASIVAYFYYFNLPLAEHPVACDSKYQFVVEEASPRCMD